ncbi:MAG: TonB-dependent receptor [Saprospiraceae bacterium]|nr:TonB-dependent receptor [Saprospiraceae bacterium]
MRIILLFLFVITSHTIYAQYSLSGKVESNAGSLIGAEVILYKMQSDFSTGTQTDLSGKFKIENLPQGEYKLVINFLGFKKYKTRFDINNDLILDPIRLEEDAIEIDGVEITGSMIQAIQKGDTTVFNAGAFKTLPDADAKELIAKIPGIVIENGTVKANGEDVQKVTVDGREFFGNDPNIALNTLPAEIIDKIEVIDEQSEQSRFTGFNDGNTTKTINIVTKQDKRNGEFGKIYAGYGENDRYQAGGNINIFNGNQRTSFIGLSNNINQQNFSTEDLLGVVGSSGNRRRGRGGRGGGGRGRGSVNNFLIGQQSGISSTNSIGMNFSDKFSEKVEFSGSYFFNNSENTSIQNIEQEYFGGREDGDIYNEDNTTESDNFNHRFQGRLEVKFDDKNSLTIRPRLSWQQNEISELADTEFLRGNGIPDVSQNIFGSDQSGYNLSNSILYRHAFEKEGRTISLSFSNNSSPGDGSSFLYSTATVDTTTVETTDQGSKSERRATGFETNLSYTEPINQRSRLMFDYELEKDNGDNEEITNNFLDPLQSNLQVDALSNDLRNEELTQTFGSGYQWRKGKTMVMARARMEHTQISADQTLPSSFVTDKSYLNFLPFVMLRMELSESKNLRLFYRPRTTNPSASQLSETVDNSNPLQLSKGNIDIDQTYQHSLFMRYSATNNKKGTVFYVFAGGDYSNNFIGERTYLSGRNVALYEELGLDTRAQLTTPENLSGYYNLRSYVTIGLPINSLKSKLNFNISGNYTNTPSIVDDNNNESQNATLGFGVNLTSNISENVDFTISSRTNVGDAKNTLLPESNTSYLNQQSSLKLDVIFPFGITWRNQVTHQIYSGYGDDFDDQFLLGSMSIGKKFLKNNRAEISVSVFDLFNQNQAISRNVSGTYIESISSNVLQRYFMVNFRYDLRHFGKSTSRSSGRKDKRRDREPRGDRRGF